MNDKVYILFYLVFHLSIVSAQNLQIHYDLSQDRSYFTSTLEMYRPDERGATFWFVDFDYNEPIQQVLHWGTGKLRAISRPRLIKTFL